jgi:hypothetical protein
MPVETVTIGAEPRVTPSLVHMFSIRVIAAQSMPESWIADVSKTEVSIEKRRM